MADTYRHPGLGFELSLAGAWSVQAEEDTQARLAIAAPGAARPAMLTVAVETLEDGADAAQLADAAIAAQAETLDGRLRVIDRTPCELGGLPAVKVEYEGPPVHGETGVAQQWHAVQGRRGWVVLAYCPVAAFPQQSELIRETVDSLVLPPPGDPPRRRPALDPDGTLRLSDDELAALRHVFGGEPAAPEPYAALQAAGVLTGGAIAPRVAETLTVMYEAGLSVTLERERAGRGYAWCHEDAAALLLPVGREHWTLRRAGLDELPGAVAEWLDLGPRPAADEREAIRTTPQELAEALAASPAGGPPEVATALADVAGHRRDRWRLVAAWKEPEHYAWLEAIDAPGGWWLVWRGDDEATLEPTDAARIWGLVSQLAGEPA